MKKTLFSPIVIIFGLAIILILAIRQYQPAEEKVIQKAQKITSKLQIILNKNIEKIKNKEQAEASSHELLTAERLYTEDEIQNATEAQFAVILNDTEARLPTMKDIKQLPSGSLHHIPALILEAGRNLGVIKEVIKFHPEFEQSVIPLYKNCALSEIRPTPVRALCLTNLIEVSKKNHLSLNLKQFPSHIVELTKLVTDM